VADLYANPNLTDPMPAPSGMPSTLWTSEMQNLLWVAAGGALTYTSTIRTPVFDLRPDLRSAIGGPKFGVPIWNKSGRLYMQFHGLSTADVLDTVICSAQEFSNIKFARMHQAPPPVVPADPGVPPGTALNTVVRCTAPVEITSEFMLGVSQPDSIVLVFAPLGEGTPARYWAVDLTFTKNVNSWPLPLPVPPAAPLPLINWEAAYY
jgi:hypothetical protein